MAHRSSLTLEDYAGKRILLRLDLNVPLRKGRIADASKIIRSLPTIKRLRRLSPLIIVTHLGEPTPRRAYEYERAFSLAPIVRDLGRRLGIHIKLVSGSWSELRAQVATLKKGDVIVLENIRFWKAEKNNDTDFAKSLASLAELYVNDAFAVSHRKHASVTAIKKFLPAFAGPQLAAEVKELGNVVSGKGSLTLILGGAKISSKLPLISKLLPRAESILVGGAIANTILKGRGIAIGKSLYDDLDVKTLRRLSSPKLILPVDAVVARGRRRSIKTIVDISPLDSIIDIGPATALRFARHVAKAQKIFWNGPLGRFEDPAARNGTKALLKVLATVTKKGTLTVVGGGESAEAALAAGYGSKLSWISTGGGASLSFLAGETMPGLQGLRY